MKKQNLRKLSRADLMELLLKQTKRADELEERAAVLEEALASRDLAASRAGSLAEASREINRIFEAADTAARQYVASVRRQADR